MTPDEIKNNIFEKLEEMEKVAERAENLGFSHEYVQGYLAALKYIRVVIEEEMK